MRNLIIGDGSNLTSWSAFVYYKREEKLIQNNISSNSILFSVRTPLFDERYIIMKDTTEGTKLKEMLNDLSVSETDIIDYIDELALRNISLKGLKNHINKIKLNSFEKGEKSIKQKFRQLISL